MKDEDQIVEETMNAAGYYKQDMDGADGILFKYVHNTKPHLWLSRHKDDMGLAYYTLRWQNGEVLVHSMEQLRWSEALYEHDTTLST